MQPVRIIFAAAWGLLFLCLYAMKRSSSRRASLTLCIIISGLVATCAGGLLVSRTYIVDDTRYGVVLDDAVAFRGPGKQYDTQAEVSNSVKVKLGGTDGQWTQVTLPNGQGAWIKSDRLAVIGFDD